MNAANQPYDTTKRPVDAKCDKCDEPAAIVAPDFALCEEHGRTVIEYMQVHGERLTAENAVGDSDDHGLSHAEIRSGETP